MFGGNWSTLPDVSEDGVLRPIPPEATPIKLPRPLVLKPARVTYNEDDSIIVKFVRNKFSHFNIRHISERDLRKFNISSTECLALVEVVAKEFVPPTSWLDHPQAPPPFVWQIKVEHHPATLANGATRPDQRKFFDLSQELLIDLKTVYRILRRGSPKEGQELNKIQTFRKFWFALNQVGLFWDDSLDDMDTTLDVQAATAQGNLAASATATQLSLEDENPLDTSDMDVDDLYTEDEIADSRLHARLPQPFTYTGRRTSTGSQMPTKMSMRLAEAFLGPIMYAFGCHFDHLFRSEQKLYLINSVMHFSNTKFIYSRPKDIEATKDGYLEGPVVVLHAYTCTDFDTTDMKPKESTQSDKAQDRKGHTDAKGKKKQSETANMEHFLRELKALLACAQGRSRENKRSVGPGHGEWWSRSREKWGRARDNGAGDRPGEAVGEPLTDLDLFPLEGLPTTTAASLFATTQQNLAAHLKNMTTNDNVAIQEESDWGPSGRSDQEGRESTSPHSSTYESDYNPVANTGLSTLSAALAWSATNLPLEPIKDTEISDEDITSNSDSASSDEGSITPIGKGSHETFTDQHNPPGSAIPNQVDRNNSSPLSNTVDNENRDADGVLDMDAEWASPSKSSSHVDIAMLPPTSITSTHYYGNSPQHPSTDTPLTQPSHKLSSEEARNEWYRAKLMEERESQEHEKRKRLHGVSRANKLGSTIFPKTKNEAKRIGIHPNASHDEIYLISVVNHHISFVHLRIHNKLLEWMSPNPDERRRVKLLKKDTTTWWGMPLKRSQWYNLFNANDRVEAMKGAWAIFSELLADTQSDHESAMVMRDRMYGPGKGE